MTTTFTIKIPDILFKEFPQILEKYFNTNEFEVYLEKEDSITWFVVKFFTTFDGELASDKLDDMEDELIDKYGDDFLKNILISPQF